MTCVAERQQLAAQVGEAPACAASCAPCRGSTRPARRGPAAPRTRRSRRSPRSSAFWPIASRNRVLPMPGLAGDEQELAVAGLDVVEPAVGELEQIVASDEERATDGIGSGIHASQFRAMSRRVIGHSTDDGPVLAGRGCTTNDPHSSGRQRQEAADGEVHGRPLRVLRGDGRAARRGARARPRDRGGGGRPLRARLARPGAGQGLLPVHGPSKEVDHADPRACGSPDGRGLRTSVEV